MALLITGETVTPQVLTGMWSNLINGSLHMVVIEPHFTTRVLIRTHHCILLSITKCTMLWAVNVIVYNARQVWGKYRLRLLRTVVLSHCL